MSNPPFFGYLLSGSTIHGQLIKIDSQQRLIHYSLAGQPQQLPLAQLSHLYHHAPHPRGSLFSFQILFSDGSTLSSEAESHQQDSAGDHLYNLSTETHPVHLFLPQESGHQLTIKIPQRKWAEPPEGQQVVTLVHQILQDAIHQRASDIHLRPLQHQVEMRYRIDGVLQLRQPIDTTRYPAVVSRIKILANMDIAEQRHPQDGAHRYSIEGRQVDLRISTLPVLEGESVVVRILDPKSGLRSLSEIGFRPRDEQKLRQMLQQKSGLILVTGPTGSGKSTTLYAAMRELRQQQHNIISLEDPVEYQMDRVRQIEINEATGKSFANNLRHVLRHDPDIILIGEIRDQETAKIALQSAYTGHLVLSTLHTGDAPSTIPRLLEMGLESYTLQDTLLGVLSQRLIRKVCDHCHGTEPEQSGCNHCNQSGYYGRLPLYELMELTPALREQIHNGVNAEEIRKEAIAAGMVPIEAYAETLLQQQTTTRKELQKKHESE